jgi:O-succinylbenzoate synthase
MNAYRFSIPFTSPLMLKGKQYPTREGVLIERDGRWAEASPLPGFSRETIDDVIGALRGEQPDPASLQFAWSSLESPAMESSAVPWNFLLMGDRDRVMGGVQRCLESGCSAAKLKVGRGELRADIELVRSVGDRLTNEVQLRLDANQAWTLEQATEFLRATENVDLEYIEEPLQNPNELETLFSKTGVRYALDETLLQHESIDAWPNATALVCKPTILGGRDVVQRLASTGKPITFSAAFESGVGIARIVQLAAEFSPGLAAGLDTLDWLTEDLLVESPLKEGALFEVAGEPIVDVSLLEPIQL